MRLWCPVPWGQRTSAGGRGAQLGQVQRQQLRGQAGRLARQVQRRQRAAAAEGQQQDAPVGAPGRVHHSARRLLAWPAAQPPFLKG